MKHEDAKTRRKPMKHPSLSDEEEELGAQVVDAAFSVHSALGPGLLESIYEKCFCHELRLRNLNVTNQIPIPIRYKDLDLKDGLRLDVLVEDKVICEIKSTNSNTSIFEAQLLSYMKLSEKRLGYLINFNVPKIKDGITRMILR